MILGVDGFGDFNFDFDFDWGVLENFLDNFDLLCCVVVGKVELVEEFLVFESNFYELLDVVEYEYFEFD